MIDKLERVRKVEYDPDIRDVVFEIVEEIEKKEKKDSQPVVYWLTREMRAENNWSLIFTDQIARLSKSPLCVIYNLIDDNKTARKLQFEIDGLVALEQELKSKNIPLKVFLAKNFDESIKKNLKFYEDISAGVAVTDFYPLKTYQNQIKTVSRKIDLYEVDAHNIIPARYLTNKQEFAARTIRPKIYKTIDQFFNAYPIIKKKNPANFDFVDFKNINLDLKKITDKRMKQGFDWINAGEKSARKQLNNLLKNNLNNYYHDWNDPNLEGQSNFSPYLHFGMISAQEIALAVSGWTKIPICKLMSSSRNRARNDEVLKAGKLDHAGAFLEELIVRKELSDNFCLYNKNYDNPAGFAPWAADSLFLHLKDQRKYSYSKKEFEEAKTHDDLWNAAQMQMVNQGKMHGYMRMYWAKKILEWTKNPAEAVETAIYLNDKYEIDGIDPNGYAGVMWSIGGVHDRPWFERLIFGKVRYMNRNGCERKFDVPKYIDENLKLVLKYYH